MFGHQSTQHHLMGVHEDFLTWVREGAGPAGVNKVIWVDNPFAFHVQRDIGLDPNMPETFAKVRTQARRFGVILLAPSWRDWHEVIGKDWAPWDNGVDCTVYDWNGVRIGTDSWPDPSHHIAPLDPSGLRRMVVDLGMPNAAPLDRLRARFSTGPVE